MKVDETKNNEIQIFAAELNDSDVPTLDLHGESIIQAGYLIDEFINKSIYHKKNVIKIITGRGSGKLFTEVDKELSNSKLVKYHRTGSDPYKAGGSFYVLLWL
ncbi:Smr/MutS family protein [Patescibacteria group bacterium]|nr:Smr/MutS family protein [Patescibacteria group bacterium]